MRVFRRRVSQFLLVSLGATAVWLAPPSVLAQDSQGTTERLATHLDTEERASLAMSMSGGGRFVSLYSATYPGGDPNAPPAEAQVFIHDRQANLTEMVSLAMSGEPGNGFSVHSSVSADGRFVAFASLASDLVPDDTNDVPDVFVRDRQFGTTERVSVSSDGEQWDHPSADVSISGDGRFVAFSSLGPTGGNLDIYLHDRSTGTTEKVSAPTVEDESSWSTWPAISGDGRHVAFVGNPHAFIPGYNAAGHVQVFVHDREEGTTELVSLTPEGEPADGSVRWPSINEDGQVVAFSVDHPFTTQRQEVFVRDRSSGTTEHIADSSEGGEHGDNSLGGFSSMSADGRYVAFDGDTDAFVHDRQLGMTERVSVSSSGQQGDGLSGATLISDDGCTVLFSSFAKNLVDGPVNDVTDVYVHNRCPAPVPPSPEELEGADEGEVSSSSAEPGAEVTVSGDGFAPDEDLDMWFFSEPVFLGTTRSDSQGRFVATIQVPQDASPGLHQIAVTGPDPEGNRRTVAAQVTVPEEPQEPAPEEPSPAPQPQCRLVSVKVSVFGLPVRVCL